jgi:hypothetical protein
LGIGPNPQSPSSFAYKFQRTKRVSNFISTGRPRKYIDLRSKRKLTTLINKRPEITLDEMIRSLRFNVCRTTMRKRLRELGFNYYNKTIKVKLNNQDMNERISFAQANLNNNYKKFIYTDEVSVEFYNSYKSKVWRKFGVIDPNKHYDKKKKTFVKRYMKFFAFMSHDGRRGILPLTERWCGPAFTSLLAQMLRIINTENKIVLCDRDTVHTSAHVSRWMQENNMRMLLTPVRSPDANPIENCFFILKKQLSKKPINKTQEELIEAVKQTFDEIDANIIKNLCKSWKSRMLAIIKVQGNNTKY